MNIRLALIVLLCAATVACEPDRDQPVATEDQAHDQHEHMKMAAGEAMTGHSVYQLQSSWQNQAGEEIQLSGFAGKPVVLAMVYTHCDYACPRIIADMRHIRNEMQADAGQVQFVLVSIDPARDNVRRLKAFGEETGLTGQGWTLLRGEEANVRELAAVFGVQYRKTTETDFAHSNIINILNSKGEIVHQQKGLGGRPDASVAALKELLQE